MGLDRELHKLRAKLLSFVAHLSLPAPNARTQPLIMTLLARNEADILRQNIDFHLKMGVDHIFATDNGSTDETPLILAHYEQLGVLTRIHEPSHTHNQAAWVNRMADMAFERFGKCFIFHCDADEFWYSRSGSLKNELCQYPLMDCLEVPVKNVLLLHHDFRESFPADALFCVERPMPVESIQDASKTDCLYLFVRSAKVIYRANSHMPHVDEGNHTLVNRKRYVACRSRDLRIYHFPIRGYEHFQKKVIEGGSAIVSNPRLKPGHGWHWRRWYKSYQAGGLQDDYRLLVLDQHQATRLVESGVLSTQIEIRSSLAPESGTGK